jgi:hypothetical protein
VSKVWQSKEKHVPSLPDTKCHDNPKELSKKVSCFILKIKICDFKLKTKYLTLRCYAPRNDGEEGTFAMTEGRL